VVSRTAAVSVRQPDAPGRAPRALGALWRVSSTLVLVALLLLTLLLVVPHLFGYRTLAVTSGSMGSAAPTGSLVFTHPVAPERVAVGDVILMHRATGGRTQIPVLHRVVERTEAGDRIIVRTKGDANSSVDPQPYALDARTGAPVLVLPWLGYGLATLQSPAGWLAFVAAPAVLLVALWLRALWRREADDDPVG
jgi:signal peptidase I